MRSIPVAAAALALLIGAHAATAQMTVYVVRHAEKAAEPANDPPLTAAGKARAKALADSMTHDGVKAIITTQFARTKETAAPTGRALGITPEVVATSGANHAAAVAAAVRRHAGQTVLVVGHSNTVPAIVAALGAEMPPPMCDSEYDDLYVVHIAADGTATEHLAHYGARTPVGPKCATMK